MVEEIREVNPREMEKRNRKRKEKGIELEGRTGKWSSKVEWTTAEMGKWVNNTTCEVCGGVFGRRERAHKKKCSKNREREID